MLYLYYIIVLLKHMSPLFIKNHDRKKPLLCRPLYFIGVCDLLSPLS